MRFQELEAEWDDDNIEHIARHGVEPEEVEEVVYEDCHPSWIVRGRRRGVRETRWTVFGQTCTGRYLERVSVASNPCPFVLSVAALAAESKHRRGKRPSTPL
ncbi:MAG: hypothetical protein ACRERD_17910, partial [Candidatus Binatia bacterium]